MRKLKIGLVLFMSASTWAFAQATPPTFTQTQKSAIESIVHDYLVKNPEVLIEVSRELESREQEKMLAMADAAIEANRQAIFEAKSPALGNKQNPKALIVEFFDYQCIHCKHMNVVTNALLKSDPDLQIIYKELPIFGEVSEFAARAAIAANKQGKYALLHDALMSQGKSLNNALVLSLAGKAGLDLKRLDVDMKSDETTEELKATLSLAEKLHIRGTPVFIVANHAKDKALNATLIAGATTQENLQTLIKKVK